MAIPLNELFAGGELRPNEIITLNINVNAMEKPSMNSGESEGFQERMGGRSAGGISGFSGGRSMGGSRSGSSRLRGGYHGNRSGDRCGLYEKAKFKQKFTLAGNL